MNLRFRRALLCLFPLAFALAALAQTESKLDYTVTLADVEHHRVHVSMTFDPESAGNEVQLPVWNALYQVRDFAKNVIAVHVASQSGEKLATKQLDKTTWEFARKPGWAVIDYDIILDEAGPFGAQLNPHHAFFNFAELLMYPVNGRDLPITVRFEQVPANWKLATALPSLSVPATQPGGASGHVLHAANYDRLVDSPCELGEFAESDFEQGGAKYRVVVDADPADYNMEIITGALKKIVAAETDWMQDRPFESYVFIYHFPRGPAGGGMEHAYSTAIDLSQGELKEMRAFDSVSAHEFFHLWNVKRIRPQSLDPIDYTRENYTRALWFSEGVTSTVGDLMLVRAGLMSPADYLKRLSGAIAMLQSRPAHLTQSVEESSLDTWFDKYPAYHAPDRSISYYNKGEIVGVLLDLKMREDSHGRRSLRELFESMNRDYAKAGKFFPDSAGVREEAEKLTGSSYEDFFREYVAGLEELPYEQMFATVGLRLERQQRVEGDLGFAASRNFTGPLIVERVYGERAQTAGIREGEEVVAVNGTVPNRGMDRQIEQLKPGDKVRITLAQRGGRREVEVTLGQRSVTDYQLVENPSATALQVARRRAWLASEDQSSASNR